MLFIIRRLWARCNAKIVGDKKNRKSFKNSVALAHPILILYIAFPLKGRDVGWCPVG